MNGKHVYIIAEVGPNHNGDVNIALNMVEQIALTGVDAIKFQMTNPYELYSDDSFKATYQKENDNAPSAREMSLRIQLTKEEHLQVYNKCRSLGVDYICTAFDIESLKFLDEHCDMAYFKIASGEIFSLDILNYMALHNRPIILSTGMATYDEIQRSIEILNKEDRKDITILHCISAYPARYEEVNLRNMQELKERFGYEIGFSDHTIGNDCAIAAVAMGACMIEKHVTYDKNADGPDHKASITIEELGSLVQSIRHIENALGVSQRVFSDTQREIAKVARKSIVTKRKISKGETITEEDICYKRPGTGFLPIQRNMVIGKVTLRDIEADRVIKVEYIE